MNDAFKTICDLIQRQAITYDEAYTLLNDFFETRLNKQQDELDYTRPVILGGYDLI